MNSIHDNPYMPGYTISQFTPDQLCSGNLKPVTNSVTVSSGKLLRGTVMGQKTIAPTAAAAAGSGNTGNGLISQCLPGVTALVGIYTIKFITPTTYNVYDPNGISLTPGSAGVYSGGTGISFVFTAGSTPMAANDTFTITVTNGDGSFIRSVANAVDGSQYPTAILADDADASAGPVTASIYMNGEFNTNAINFDSSWTLAKLSPLLTSRNIFLKTMSAALSSADPL